ncbi:MAG: galactokinase family protein [Candidatus Latescibacterota bacterium]
MDIRMDAISLVDTFRTHYGKNPAWLVSAPGRVNLIGEHTDYNGFPVLPISIPYSIRAAISSRSDRTVKIMNTATGYPPREFLLE